LRQAGSNVAAPLGSVTAILSATSLLATMGMNAYGGMLTVLTGIPWTALNLVDFFFVRRGQYAITDIFRVDGVYGAWNWRGLLAYALGLAAEIPFMVLFPIAGFSYTGPIPAHLTSGVDYSWIVGLVVSGLVYWVLSRSLDRSAERAAIEASDRQLEAITHD